MCYDVMCRHPLRPSRRLQQADWMQARQARRAAGKKSSMAQGVESEEVGSSTEDDMPEEEDEK